MKKLTLAALTLAIASFGAPALAQNITHVNGKPVPKARLDLLVQQAEKSGQKVPAEMMGRARDEVVMREIFAQEAERRGLQGSADYQAKLTLARQSILINELLDDFRKKNPISDADAKAEYDKFKAQATGTEYRAKHILVEKEDEAKALLAQLKGGAKFDELAKKHSKDPGSGANGGDLDWAKSDAYVPEFGKAMAELKKGETTEVAVKTQFGFHIIRLEDTRDAAFPEFESVKPQIRQRLEQAKVQEFQESLRKGAKTDYKFGGAAQ